MLIKSGMTGEQMSIVDAPKITFDGDWMPWRPEFYNGVLYWEAWFLSSGALTVEDGYSYIGDAWGIGGGAQAGWSYGGSLRNVKAGVPNMRTGITFQGNIAVTIGSGGLNNGDDSAGGATKLGDFLTCAGGNVVGTNSVDDDYKRYRFEDATKAAEAGRTVTVNDGTSAYTSQGGWLKMKRTGLTSYTGTSPRALCAQGEGLGAGGSYQGWSAPGALVVRVPA